MPTITLYGSSSPRTPPAYVQAAAAVGAVCARRGWRLRTGAGRHGCMGAAADACIAAGGTVEGVILRKFLDEGLSHPDLARLAVADDMRSRKRLLAEGAAAYICLPGGPGTWEEFWEMVVQRQIGVVTAPLLALDVAGHYAPFRSMLQRAHDDGLLYGPPQELVEWHELVPAAEARLMQHLSPIAVPPAR